ncbi:MAG: thiamine diphosphokinase [Spirochaetaceae bacterium]|jgi:thiamine pyrophosphokinase|nr:thiamine diphosphokinase [Spirochaetaceae bacterium]
MAKGDRLGIIFIGGEGPEPEQCRILVEEQETPLVAAADSGLFAAEAAGMRPRWIIGDMDSLGSGGTARLAAYGADQILRYPPDKDYTDTELAVSALWERGCTRIWLVGGGGGRVDHLFAIRALFEREKTPERWISRDDIWRLEGPGEFTRVSRPGEGDCPVSVFPLGTGPWKAESSGLAWPLAGLPWSRGFFGISNTAPGGGFTIRAIEGRFMLILPFSLCLYSPDVSLPGNNL